MSRRAHHCGGFRTVEKNGVIEIKEIRGRACRSADGLCACSCAACVRARECKHENTFLSFGSMRPFLPELRLEMGHGRATREDGTAYVGPTMTARPREPDDPKPKAVSWESEMCIACGMRIRGTRREEKV